MIMTIYLFLNKTNNFWKNSQWSAKLTNTSELPHKKENKTHFQYDAVFKKWQIPMTVKMTNPHDSKTYEDGCHKCKFHWRCVHCGCHPCTTLLQPGWVTVIHLSMFSHFCAKWHACYFVPNDMHGTLCQVTHMLLWPQAKAPNAIPVHGDFLTNIFYNAPV